VDKAVAIVLAGAVELLADGTAKVASQSNSSIAYHVVQGSSASIAWHLASPGEHRSWSVPS
jgi:hypothetical protein